MRQPWKAFLAALLAVGLNAPAAAACLAFQDRASCCGSACPMDEGAAACCGADARESVPVVLPPSGAQVLPSSAPALRAPAPVLLGVLPSPSARPSLEASAEHSGLSPPAA